MKQVTITDSHAGQRIDNFLITYLKGVPKSRIYRALRNGEVRVNKGRIKANYRLKLDDQVRIPPIRVAEKTEPGRPSEWQLQQMAQNIIHEDTGLIIVNKPAGMAVHGGSGISFGVIETLRFLRPQAKFLELVHRLDRDTSGCLMIAKKRSALTETQDLFRNHQIEKVYLALVAGKWEGGQRKIDAPLLKNVLESGERMVHVNHEGKEAVTIVQPLLKFKNATLLTVFLKTGRTHQIRVHLQHIGHPIAGDEKYGDKEFNKQIRQLGFKRLFLHAASLTFKLPSTAETIALCACLDKELLDCLKKLS